MKLIITAILILTCFNTKYVRVSSVSCNSQDPKAFLFTNRKSCGSALLAAVKGTPVVVTEKKRYALDTSVQLVPRGGDIAGIAAKDVAKTFSAIVSVKAVSGTFFPSASCKIIGVEVPPKSISRLVIEALGGAAGSLSISSYLAVTNKVSSVDKAIAYGLISQLFFLIRGIATNRASMALIMPNFKIDLLLYVSLIVIILSGLLSEPPALLIKSIIGYKLLDSLKSYFILPQIGAVSEGRFSGLQLQRLDKIAFLVLTISSFD
jgi:hypothetical protein